MSETVGLGQRRGDGVLPANDPPTAPVSRGVWEGTWAELDALDLPEPVAVARLGKISLEAESCTLIAAPPASTKTWLGLHAVAAHVLNGGRGLLVEGEGSKRTIRSRLRCLTRGLGFASAGERGSDLRIVQGHFALDDRASDWRPWRELLERAQPSIVMVDPLVTFANCNENDAGEMSRFLRVIDIARERGAAVLVLHHTTKEDDQGRVRVRGSTALEGWADTVVLLRRPSPDGPVTVVHKKPRDVAQVADQTLTWTWEHDPPGSTRLVSAALRWDGDVAAAPGRAAAAIPRRSRQFLARITEYDEGLTRSDLRTWSGLGGTGVDRMLEPLFAAGLVHVATVERRDKRDRVRDVEVIRSGGGPVRGPMGDPTDEDPTDAPITETLQ